MKKPYKLTTRLDTEQEKEAFLQEIRQEKEQEMRIEEKIRILRKAKHKARLNPENGRNVPPPKKRIQENSGYISIRKTWGPPQVTFPVKKVAPEVGPTDPPPPPKKKKERKP